jgi:hypothetical protein
MIKFFRQIRRSLINQNQMGKYFKYAIGEILLVVIGILLALQINNWNENKKERITEEKLLEALHKDLLVNIDRFKVDIILEQRSIAQSNTIVNHLDDNKPYATALDTIFNEALFSPDITLSSSSYESIKSKGIDIIQNDSLRNEIIYVYDVVYTNLIAETVRLENQFWPSSVLPMIHKHFRKTTYTAIPINYEALKNDDTFKNMIIHRSGFRELALKLKIDGLKKTTNLLTLISKRRAVLNK